METQIEDIKKAWISLRRSQRLSLLEEYEFVQKSVGGSPFLSWSDSQKKRYKTVVMKNFEIETELIDFSTIIDLKNHDKEFFLKSIKLAIKFKN